MTDSTPQIFPRFAGKTVLVTGAGTGFGAEIAVRAAQEGAKVAVHYRSSKAGAEATLERIREAGSDGILVQADIGSWDQIKRMADEVWAAFGTLDVLVNNVGDVSSEQMNWDELTQEALDAVIDIDVKGTLLMTHEFGERMLKQGHGSIVQVGSTVIVRGSARAPQYAAAKYAILGITKSYAKAFAPAVRVNTFAPGLHGDRAAAEPRGLEERPPRGAALADADGRHPAARVRGRRVPLARDRRGGSPDRRLHARRRRLQHGRRVAPPPSGR